MKVLLLAGEESGVLYAKRIADKMRATMPDVEIRGYGDYGFETGDLAVFGIFAVLRRIFFFLRVKRTMQRAIDAWRPDTVCTVDYPGMNLKLAAYAKKKGIRAVHVVCPQVWAWHQGRIPKIEKSLDKLCCFFPFEPALFTPGFAEFIGHPLAHSVGRRVPSAPHSVGRGVPSAPIVAVLPGSRVGEIEKILPTLLQAAQQVAEKFPDVSFVIPAANTKAKAAIEAKVKAKAKAKVKVVDGMARELLSHATCAVVASGTATLEAALARCPTLLVYRVSALTAMIARRVITGVKHVGLANVIAEKAGMACPMPELLQEDFTVEAVVACLEDWLSDPAKRVESVADLDRVMALLNGGDDPIGRIVQSMT